MYQKKFKPGKQIGTAEEDCKLILNREFIFMRHKPYHYGWSSSWSIMTILRMVNRGYLFTAKENKNVTK